VLSIAAVVCFVVYYEMVTSSYIEHVSSKGVIVSRRFARIDCFSGLIVPSLWCQPAAIH
jgi:hypothetical protein